MMPKSPKKVFISFKTEEKHHALIFKEALEKVGYLVWWQIDLQCGHEWHGEIDKALNDAGAIIVLWSPASHKSPWVRHEASQAMAMNRYAPVRIEVFNIDNPYNRIQATDINDWKGEINHPGFQNLLTRLNELMPPPITVWHQSKNFLWKQKAVIVLSAIAAIALFLLLKQGLVLNQQIEKQEQTFKNVQKQSKRLDSLGGDLKTQLEVQKLFAFAGVTAKVFSADVGLTYNTRKPTGPTANAAGWCYHHRRSTRKERAKQTCGSSGFRRG